MKIPRGRRISKRTAVIIAVVLILAASSIVYLAWLRSAKSDNDDIRVVERGGNTTIEIDDNPVGDVDYSSPDETESNPATDDLPTAPDPMASGPIPMSITYAGGSPLQVRVVANEILSAGSCTLRLERGGQSTISQEVETFAATSYTTCKGFTVDTSGQAKGVWKLTVDMRSGERKGSVSKDITI